MYTYYDENKNLILDSKFNILWLVSELDTLVTLEEAKKFIKKFKFEEYSNWKIPKKQELEELINFINTDNLEKTLFPKFNDWNYLTTTTYFEKFNFDLNYERDYIWVGSFDLGSMRSANKDHKFYLKPCWRL